MLPEPNLPGSGGRKEGPRLGQRPWLDGMRAIAVLAVFAFHEQLFVPHYRVPWAAPGGDLGVDVFFVISGFLITTLLLEEHDKTGRISRRSFYLRRARRLLPAVVVLVLVMAGGAVTAEAGATRARTLEHCLVAVSYVANWVRAAGHDLGGLNHTWSLAIEEQFYVVWPVVLIGLLSLRMRARTLGCGLLIGSVVAMLWRTTALTSFHWSQVRVYNGSDTRCDGLLLGCALGVLFHHGLLPDGSVARWVRRSLGVAGAMAFLGLVHLTAAPERIIPVCHIDTRAVVELGTAAVIWALLAEGTSLPGRALASWPARSLGRISYGVYLYSFPLDGFITPHVRTIRGPELVVLHLAAAVAVASLSYWTVERAFRRPGLVSRAGPSPLIAKSA